MRIRIEIDLDHTQVTVERQPQYLDLDGQPALVARQLLDAAWMDGCAWLVRQAEDATTPRKDTR